ncbi:MAG: prolipoprotein diacylglyceryl transferase [Pseudomonadota bacterium]
MYPVLFKIPVFGGITIYSYGVMVAAAFLVALAWIVRESRRLDQDPAKAMDLAFYVILAAIVGSRILHVAVSERERFFANPLMFFRIWEGGLVFYGGLIASIAVGTWYIRRHRMPVLITFDIFAPAVALGHSVGRLGCLLAGCCYGRAVGHPAWYAIVFQPSPRTFAPTGIPLYPAQTMESMGELSIFLILLLIRRFKSFNGQLISSYLMLYAVLRSFNEYFRGDVERGFVVGRWFSTSQFISILMFAAGLALYLKERKTARCAEAGK